MKKNIVILIIVLIFLTLVGVILYATDMNRIKNNKPVLFSTWGYAYVPSVTLQEDKIEIAIKDFLVDRNDKESIHYDNEKWFAVA